MSVRKLINRHRDEVERREAGDGHRNESASTTCSDWCAKWGAKTPVLSGMVRTLDPGMRGNSSCRP
jgi:hypothetical protein